MNKWVGARHFDRRAGRGDRAGAIRRRLCRTRLGRSLGLGVLMGSGVASLLLVVQQLSTLPIFITSWASSSALILSAPRSRAARPHIVIIAHVMCGAIGLLVDAGVDSHPLAIVIGLALSLFAMFHMRVIHPPAAANAAIVVTTTVGHGPLMVGWIGGSLCLSALSMLMRMVSAADEWQD